MATAAFTLKPGRAWVVGSFATTADILAANPDTIRGECDLLELRLDLLLAEGNDPLAQQPWQHLAGQPLLFTARRGDEGGGGHLDAEQRMELLAGVLDQASLVDVEVASIAEMGSLIGRLEACGIPWIASFHDFDRLPDNATLATAAARARDAGAAAFKAAARLQSPADMARLAEFQLEDHGLPVATMGMGSLAPLSRLLCAQCGSVLNYGFLGGTPTAPGQWEAGALKRAVARLSPLKPR